MNFQVFFYVKKPDIYVDPLGSACIIPRLGRGLSPRFLLFNNLIKKIVWALTSMACFTRNIGASKPDQASELRPSSQDWLPLAAIKLKLKSLILAQIERWRHA